LSVRAVDRHRGFVAFTDSDPSALFQIRSPETNRRLAAIRNSEPSFLAISGVIETQARYIFGGNAEPRALITLLIKETEACFLRSPHAQPRAFFARVFVPDAQARSSGPVQPQRGHRLSGRINQNKFLSLLSVLRPRGHEEERADREQSNDAGDVEQPILLFEFADA